jgi:hypothetical protein
VIRPRKRVDQSAIARSYAGQVGHGQPDVAVEWFVDPLLLLLLLPPRPLEVPPGGRRPQIRLLNIDRH